MERTNTNNKRISIVIPVKNGIKTLPECLEGIRQQTLYEQCEIIVIDSGSTDGTVEYLHKQKDVQLKEIPPATFNHGLTRVLGVSLAKGDFIAMTVQDATPVDDQWLEKLIRHFDDPEVAGVCGQQVVPHHKDKNPHEWFRPVSAPSLSRLHFSSSEFDNLASEEKKNACRWDNVNAMYRREALERIPFRRAFFSEDARWSMDALLAGYVLVYDKSACLHHYHFQTFDYAYKRMLTQLYFDYKLFGYRRSNSFKALEYLKIVYRNFKYRVHPKWIFHNYQIIRARNRAFRDFYRYLTLGDDALEAFYKNTCRVPPQGKVRS